MTTHVITPGDHEYFVREAFDDFCWSVRGTLRSGNIYVRGLGYDGASGWVSPTDRHDPARALQFHPKIEPDFANLDRMLRQEADHVGRCMKAARKSRGKELSTVYRMPLKTLFVGERDGFESLAL